MALITTGQVGPQTVQDGSNPGGVRMDKQGSQVVADGHGRYHETTYRGNVFSVTAGTLTLAAGNIQGAAAAASTNFAVWNPANTGKILSILKVGFGYHSGTPAAGPLLWGYLPNHAITIGSTANPTNNYIGGPGASVARYVGSAGGTALTGGTAPGILRVSAFDLTAIATPGAAVLGQQLAQEEIAGEIIIGPGQGFLPLFQAAGTTQIFSISVTWEELPV